MNDDENTTDRAGLHITDLQAHLMATLASLRDRENPMDVDRARVVATVAGVLVDTAKVEVEFIKATGQDQSKFLAQQLQAPETTVTPGAAGTGISSITRHRLGR